MRKSTSSSSQPTSPPPDHTAGSDEVGRGCLAGPVVASTVVLPLRYHLPGLADSKKLSPAQRQELAHHIKLQALAWSIGTASPQEIDQINILQATLLAMHRALDRLTIKPTLLLVDGPHFKPYPGLAHQCIIKGDSTVPAISAASILAKTYRDQLMKKWAIQYPGYGWETNVGYPTTAHRRAIHQLGYTPQHRRSYRVRPADSKLPSPT